MNSIILIMCYVILPVISLRHFSFNVPSLRRKLNKMECASSMRKDVEQIKPKLCIDCKYFIPDNGNGIFGKCSLFQKKEGTINFLVNGIHDQMYYYCTTSRESKDMCGEEGKYYKKKIVKKDMS